MTRFRRVLLSMAILLGLVGAVGAAPGGRRDRHPRPAEAAPGVTVLEEQPVAAPYRFFVLSITQPVDHLRPSAGTFQQRFTVLHRGTDRPTVLHTTGYNGPAYAFRSEPTRLVDGNQLSVEQRFFTPSRPEPADWSKLTIWQAATDHHRIVAALKPIYPQKWISTGASKGGMTSIYHRRFYPADVDGTVAYVAPQDVVNGEDSAYDRFFAGVGTAQCRAALDAVQVEALRRRTELVARYQAWAADNARTFTVIGSADKAFEFIGERHDVGVLAVHAWRATAWTCRRRPRPATTSGPGWTSSTGWTPTAPRGPTPRRSYRSRYRYSGCRPGRYQYRRRGRLRER